MLLHHSPSREVAVLDLNYATTHHGSITSNSISLMLIMLRLPHHTLALHLETASQNTMHLVTIQVSLSIGFVLCSFLLLLNAVAFRLDDVIHYDPQAKDNPMVYEVIGHPGTGTANQSKLTSDKLPRDLLTNAQAWATVSPCAQQFSVHG